MFPTCFNINASLDHFKMLIFRLFYKQFATLVNLFNMFQYQYKFESFENVNFSLVLSAIVHIDEDFQHVWQSIRITIVSKPSSTWWCTSLVATWLEYRKAFKINRKLNIYKWIRVTRNQKNRPTFPQGGRSAPRAGCETTNLKYVENVHISLVL